MEAKEDPMTSEERFERIDAILDRLAESDERMNQRLDRLVESDERMNQKFERLAESDEHLRTAHMELEAAQLNQQRAHTKLEEALTSFIDETRERITNLTILVDRLVERDLGRSGGETI